MSGRHEKEMQLKHKIQKRLNGVPDVVEEYYYSLIGSGKSYETAYRYINHVISFLNFTFKGKCKEDFYLNVKPIHINKYITSLRTKEVNGKTERTSDSIKSVQWSALNSFFQFLVPDYININPVANTNRPKMKDKPKVTYLTSEEVTKMLHNVERTANNKFKNRDLCILKLGFSTGLRVSAIVQIDIDDIDFQNNQISVTEKGDYDDRIMFGENLKKQLLLWLEDRKKYFSETNSNSLFVSQFGQRLGDDAIANMLKKYANGVTDKKVTPHVMRHTCATNLYEKTGDIYLTSRQLRHKSVTVTQRYAEISEEKQKVATSVLDNLI
jgi:site-specific recombinase XerD